MSGSEAGHPMFTRELPRALVFSGQEQARRWLDCYCVTSFGAIVLLRQPGSRAEHNRVGAVGHYRPRAST